jgi:cell division initiation protein
MFTPQQIEQISFSQAKFNGYDKRSVDEFLEPLTEDYITLYKENALLKSKMRVLVAKLEEYRANEASMKEAIANAQKACDTMVKDTESKCTQMLEEANVTATENANVLIEAENERLEEARRVTSEKILAIENQLKDALELLGMIRKDNSPAKAPAQVEKGSAEVAEEISQNLEALVGKAENAAPTAEPKHPISDTTSSKFANLQFGRNYDRTHK